VCNAQAKRVDSALAAEVVLSTQAAAARAAANVTAGLGKNLVSPKTSYEFEAVWKGLSGNRSSQAHLLKIMDPLSLPKLFKDSLGAPLLMEIIQSLPLLLQ
jgi:predicted glycosyltransferase